MSDTGAPWYRARWRATVRLAWHTAGAGRSRARAREPARRAAGGAPESPRRALLPRSGALLYRARWQAATRHAWLPAAPGRRAAGDAPESLRRALLPKIGALLYRDRWQATVRHAWHPTGAGRSRARAREPARRAAGGARYFRRCLVSRDGVFFFR
ncbi:MAG TPA: hypothetical protein DDY29_09785, partial [Rhodobacteraceae bacterium]|nr:hypothetical protein [Paracoccaceae bacterium]